MERRTCTSLQFACATTGNDPDGQEGYLIVVIRQQSIHYCTKYREANTLLFIYYIVPGIELSTTQQSKQEKEGLSRCSATRQRPRESGDLSKEIRRSSWRMG